MNEAGASLTDVVITGDLVGVGGAAARETTEAADKTGVAGGAGTIFAGATVDTAGRAGGEVTGVLDLPLAPTVVQAPPICPGITI